MADILDFFLSIQKQPQERAKEPLNLISRRHLRHSSLDILWSEVWCRSWEDFMESGTEHYNELDCSMLAVYTGATMSASSKVYPGSMRTYCDMRIVCQDILMRR